MVTLDMVIVGVGAKFGAYAAANIVWCTKYQQNTRPLIPILSGFSLSLRNIIRIVALPWNG